MYNRHRAPTMRCSAVQMPFENVSLLNVQRGACKALCCLSNAAICLLGSPKRNVTPRDSDE